jgi:hypothetical protein
MEGLARLWRWEPRGLAPVSLEEAWSRLLPKVRPRFHYEALTLRENPWVPVNRPLAGTFAHSLVVDFPEGEIDVTPGLLQGWGGGYERLLLKALSNLLARGAEERFARIRPGTYRSTWGDELDGSRILLPGVIRRLSVAGEPVALMPRRDVLLVTGSEDPGGLTLALESALDMVDEGTSSLNACPLRMRHFQWSPLELPDSHPAAPLLARAHRSRLQGEYARQKTLLDRAHRLDGRLIDVAPFRVAKDPSGRMASFTRWTRDGSEGWLPEADHLCLAWGRDLATESLWASWQAVRRRLGHLLEPLGLFPERYRFRTFPSPGDLEALGRKA